MPIETSIIIIIIVIFVWQAHAQCPNPDGSRDLTLIVIHGLGGNSQSEYPIHRSTTSTTLIDIAVSRVVEMVLFRTESISCHWRLTEWLILFSNWRNHHCWLLRRLHQVLLSTTPGLTAVSSLLPTTPGRRPRHVLVTGRCSQSEVVQRERCHQSPCFPYNSSNERWRRISTAGQVSSAVYASIPSLIALRGYLLPPIMTTMIHYLIPIRFTLIWAWRDWCQ